MNDDQKQKDNAGTLSEHEIVMCFDDFFEIYNVTEKDKAELLRRLIERHDGYIETINRLKNEMKNVWSDINAAIHMTPIDKELLENTLEWSKGLIKDVT